MYQSLFRTVICLFFCLLSCSFDKTDGIKYLFINESDADVEFLFPADPGRSAPYHWGDMRDIAPNDTTMASAGKAHFSRIAILPHSQWRYNSGYESIEEMSPYDTVRIFVYDHGYYNLNSPEMVFERELFYCRYDLTPENLHNLINTNGDIQICYPPSKSMSEVKMNPSFEEIVLSLD